MDSTSLDEVRSLLVFAALAVGCVPPSNLPDEAPPAALEDGAPFEPGPEPTERIAPVPGEVTIIQLDLPGSGLGESAVVVGPDGSLRLESDWVAAAGGFDLFMQWWVTDAGGPVGFAASNGLKGTTP